MGEQVEFLLNRLSQEEALRWGDEGDNRWGDEEDPTAGSLPTTLEINLYVM